MLSAHSEDVGHRRGFVLGQTLAEVMTLIIFVLLLSLGIHIRGQDKENQALTTQNEDLRRVLESIRSVIGSDENELSLRLAALQIKADRYDNILRELEEVRQALEQEKGKSSRLQADLENFKELFEGQDGGFDPESIEASLSELREFQRVTQAAGLSPTPEALTEKLDEITMLEAAINEVGGDLDKLFGAIPEAARLKGQLASAQRLQENAGRRGNLPSCWATEDGRPEYLYDVALRSDGIFLRKIVSPHRAEDWKLIPAEKVLTDRVISEVEFRQMTYPLFQWSDERKCRFFVRIWDQTELTQKEAYKERLDTVESHFYKLLMSGQF
jgi:hypothetical protein